MVAVMATVVAVVVALAALAAAARPADPSVPSSLFDVKVNYLDGTPLDWNEFKGNKVFLIANVASECGFTEKGYMELVQLDRLYPELLVLAAPCNDFGGQEPGGPEEIQRFAEEKGAKFPLLEKMSVNGPDAHMLFRFLKGEYLEDTGCADIGSMQECVDMMQDDKCDTPEAIERCEETCEVCLNNYDFFGDVKWNFEFFLVDIYGEVMERWETGSDMLDEEAIQMISIFAEEVHYPEGDPEGRTFGRSTEGDEDDEDDNGDVEEEEGDLDAGADSAGERDEL